MLILTFIVQRVSYIGSEHSAISRTTDLSAMERLPGSVQVYVTFSSNFDTQYAKTHPPTESFLRKAFVEYRCNLLDVIVKDYVHIPEKQSQCGYAILSLASFEEASNLCVMCPSVTFEEVLMSCSLSPPTRIA